MSKNSTNGDSGHIDDSCQLIKVERVAELLGLSTRTVWRRVSAGQLPAPRRIGGATLWRLQEIKTWVDTLFGLPPNASEDEPDEGQ